MHTVDHAAVASPARIIRRLSLVPLVGLGVGWFWIAQANRLHEAGALSTSGFNAMLIWIAALGLWGVLMSWLSFSGRGRSLAVLRLLPGLWLPPLPVFATVVAIIASPALRSAFVALASQIPDDQLILLQVLRVAAIGSLIKTSLGRLPPAFGFGTGIPDFLFGASAAMLLWTGGHADLAPSVLVAWNIVGALIFMVAALVMQLCLPGPLQIFRSQPDGREVLDFPLFLAPALFGPVLVIGNCLHAAKYLL